MESDKEKLQKLCDLLKKIDPEEKVFKQETILNNNNNKEYKKELLKNFNEKFGNNVLCA